ncbi:MAG: hypothetical protein K0Q49_905 [Haloplasmataceae bacterium]|nr:hypothetical protein [Haloplasmataceae bacterium]
MKMFIISALMLTFLSFGLSVGATDTINKVVIDSDELPNAGLIPGNALYSIDKFLEKLNLKFTFSKERKAEKLAKIAEKRLAELDILDPKIVASYANKLFIEYGLSLERANICLQKLLVEGRISDERLAKLEARVNMAEGKITKVNEKAKAKISYEVKDCVLKDLNSAKMSLFTRFTDIDSVSTLHDQGYGYSDLLKLHVISAITSKTVDELLLIDHVVTINDEKVVNLSLLLESLGLSITDLKVKLLEYIDIN